MQLHFHTKSHRRNWKTYKPNYHFHRGLYHLFSLVGRSVTFTATIRTKVDNQKQSPADSQRLYRAMKSDGEIIFSSTPPPHTHTNIEAFLVPFIS